MPGEFYVAATRPPAVYRGNPFLIEVGAGLRRRVARRRSVSLEALTEMLAESDARTLRQFLISTFNGIGAEAADKILTEAELGQRACRPASSSRPTSPSCTQAMRSVNLDEGQTMNVLRYANRVPLQFQPAACAITQIDHAAPTGGPTA